ncbi:hypothetical protein E4N70_07270 [Treponema vincentii]|uniref:Uncharacterized protein n=3 Tax=Treponema vincentii TaxID=69710 RepID=S3LT75_9SPIR|nr:hypothetical protein HMPREF1222_00544 [Treponema vincentii F0403]UTC59254.1 hypothetical protein E4N70_07270 [Treponema vincentii]
MKIYKKSLPYICLMVLALGYAGCSREARQETAQTCSTSNNRSQTAAASEKPVTHVVFDDKALAALTKQNATAVYCIAMGAS